MRVLLAVSYFDGFDGADIPSLVKYFAARILAGR